MKWMVPAVILYALLLLVYKVAFATELVYTPVNPSFGGSPLNGSWMLGSAQSQNKFSDDRGLSSGRDSKTFGRRMAEDVVRRVVSRTEREILNRMFDSEGSLSSADIGGYGGDLYTDEVSIQIDVYQYGDGNSAVIDSAY